MNKAGRSTASLLTRWPRWGYLVANLAHPNVMPPQHHRDGKSRATLCRQGTRLGKRQRAEARELEQMRSHDRVALPAAPPQSSAGSSMDHLQQPARPAPAEGKGASAQVELSQHVGATAAPCGCQPGRWPYMAPSCPPMLPLQCLRPSVEEGRIGEAWAEPVLPAPEPVVATTGAEPLASPVTRPGRLARDQSNWKEPASMQATGVADVSAGPRPMHRHRPTSSSSTPSSTDTEDAAPQSTPPVANLHVHSQEETSRSDPPFCSSAPGPCQPHGPVVSTSMSGSSSTSGQPPGPNRERCKEGSMDDTSGGLPAEPAPLSQHGGMGMLPQAGSSNSEEASSEEMIPDHLLPRRVPPAPPLPRRLRSVQISTSGASSSAAPPRRVRGRSDTSSSSELREDDTTSSSESAGTVKGAPDRGRVIQHMDALRAKLMQALTKRAKMNPLNVPGLLYHCHAQCCRP